MPYKIYSYKGKYRVCKPGGKKCFSKKGLSKAKAEAQRRALYASENVNESLDVDATNFFTFKNVLPGSSPSIKRVTYNVKSDETIDLIVAFKDGEATTFFIKDCGIAKGKDIRLADVGANSSEETGIYSEHVQDVLRLYTPKLFKRIKDKEHLKKILDQVEQDGFDRIYEEEKEEKEFRESYEFEEFVKHVLAE